MSSTLIERIIIEHGKRFELPLAASQVEFIVRVMLEVMREWSKGLSNHKRIGFNARLDAFAKENNLEWHPD